MWARYSAFWGQTAPEINTIRLLMDLIHPTTGVVHIFGHDVKRDHHILCNVGAIVEQAAFYPFLTGQRNLDILVDVGNHDPKRIPLLLEQVGLAQQANVGLSAYSAGMRQRLGLAAALLGDPDPVALYRFTPSFNIGNIHTWMQSGKPLDLGLLSIEASLGFSLLVVGIWIVGMISLITLLFQRQDITT